MKKLLRLLTILVLFYSSTNVYGQSTIFVRAPAYVKSIPSSLPIELFVQPYTNGCYLITAPELAALTGSNMISFGIHLFSGYTANATGSINVYLQNTNDLSYTKGNNFNTCTSGMSNVFTGTTVLAATYGTTDVTCFFQSPFVYTGGGLYVAFSWTAGVSSTPIALYSYGSSSPSFGAIKGQTSLTSAINNMTTTAYRPTFVFGITNTATNEAAVEVVLAPGKVAEGLHASQIVQATIRNLSAVSLSNVPVSLSISGANSFTDSQIIPSFSPGTVKTVSFSAYTPTALGSSTMVVTIPADQNTANNSGSWTQSVSCDQTGHGPPNISYYQPVAWQGILAGRFNYTAASTMSVVRLAISSTGINDIVYGVLCDKNGTMIAYTNTLLVTSGMVSTFQTFTFTPARVLQANTDYYIGMAIPNANLSTMGCVRYTDGVPGNRFGVIPIAGGTFSVGNPAYYGIEPVLSGTINVSPTTSVICKDDELLLIPSSGKTFTWSNSSGIILPANANGGLLVVPVKDETYTVKARDAAGCIGKGTVFLKLEECTGVSKLYADEKIQLYPNPTVNGLTTIRGLEGTNKIVVLNMLGQEIFQMTSTNEILSIHMQGQVPGNYFVKITDSNGHAKTLKFIYEE